MVLLEVTTINLDKMFPKSKNQIGFVDLGVNKNIDLQIKLR
jgi:hypothetical protein